MSYVFKDYFLKGRNFYSVLCSLIKKIKEFDSQSRSYLSIYLSIVSRYGEDAGGVWGEAMTAAGNGAIYLSIYCI